MPLHLEEFMGEEFQGYIENVPPQRSYPLSSLLPVEQIDDIDFSWNVIEGRYAQAASITGWNASTPLRDKKELSKMFGSIAKIQHGFRLDEKEILKFHKPRSEAEKQRVVDHVYADVDELVVGVDDTEEFLRSQVLYEGTLVYEDTVNDVKIDVDFGIPAENKISATVAWSDPTSTPLDDIRAAIKQYQDANQKQKPVVMHMTSAAEANLLLNQQIRMQVYGDNGSSRLITLDDVRNVFSALGFPPYAINDDVVSLDGETTVQLLADNKVAFFGSGLGKTYLGPTQENNFRPGKFGKTKVEEDPPQQFVRVGEAAFPALARPQSIVHLTI
jgi:Phage major capsid protein E